MLAVAVDDFYCQFGTSHGEDWTNELMPNRRTAIHEDTLAAVVGEMGVDLEGFYRLPACNILAK